MKRMMWGVKIVITGAAMIFSHPVICHAEADHFIVKEVKTGDTIVLDNNVELRLIGLDAPEPEYNSWAERDVAIFSRDLDSVVEMGRDSREFLADLLEGQKIRVEYGPVRFDDEGRLLGYVFAFKTFVNATLIAAGYAIPVKSPPNNEHAEFLERVYIQAKKEKRGLWKND